ncbi:hypothetical protein [Leucobacter chinensis]|uniref:hypothetical protein n=1 Tax=Leucobacter chinensis TaxID=2851010 RepID=UPI001C245ADC|nr:hypothetical protein [Leucobacter chinensis]
MSPKPAPDPPLGITVDTTGNLYVVDSSNNRIRKITPDGMVSTVAGTDMGGFADGSADQAKFAGPVGISIDTSGNVYVTDSGNNRI